MAVDGTIIVLITHRSDSGPPTAADKAETVSEAVVHFNVTGGDLPSKIGGPAWNVGVVYFKAHLHGIARYRHGVAFVASLT